MNKTIGWLLAPALLLLPAQPARPQPWTPGLEGPRCRLEDWSARLGLVLGPQYYLQRKDQVQFSFGLEGRFRLVGPLSAGMIARVGVIADTTLMAAGSARLHVLRSCLLSLAIEVRAGALVWLVGEGDKAAPLVGGGLELTHDIGDAFIVFVQGGVGHVFHQNRGVVLDLVVGLGIQL